MRIHSFEPVSYVDGPGRRAVLFMQGCELACAGCQNRALWDASRGVEMTPEEVAGKLAQYAQFTDNQVTISGGDPLAQPAALAELVERLKIAHGIKHLIVYTGYRFEDLFDDRHPAHPFLAQILAHVDVLVDGPFVQALDSPYLSHRGSTNQRPIDVPASLAAMQVVTLNWDNVEVAIMTSGEALMPVGLREELGARLGTRLPQRRCGERIHNA